MESNREEYAEILENALSQAVSAGMTQEIWYKMNMRRILTLTEKAQKDFAIIEKKYHEKLKLPANHAQEKMLISKEETWKYIKDQDPLFRKEAIYMLRIYWREGEVLRPICEEMSINDSEPNVRSMAISILGIIFRNSFNQKLAKHLAAIVLNEGEEKAVRLSAYLSFLELLAQKFPELPKSLDDFPRKGELELIYRFI